MDQSHGPFSQIGYRLFGLFHRLIDTSAIEISPGIARVKLNNLCVTAQGDFILFGNMSVVSFTG